MRIVRVPIDQVKTWKDNPRTIKKGDYERLKKQILELGFYKPLVATREGRNYIVIGGNMRLRVLKEIGANEVEISIVDAPTDDVKLKYTLSDNDRAGAWDDQALAEMAYKTKDRIGDLEMFKIDLAAPLPISRVLDAFGPSQDPEEDQVPKPEPKAISCPGDLFTLGRHRLLCGDATNQAAYDRLLNGKKADLIFTDPPYNVAYQGTKFAPILNDDLSEEGFISFVEVWMERLKCNTKQGGVFYICSGYSSYPAFIYTIKKTGMTFAGPIVWVKNNTSLGWNDYRHKHEMVLKGTTTKAKKAVPILYGWNGGRHYFFESRFEADVWEMNRRASTTMLHPTQKPLGLIQRAIKNSSRPGELVLDSFAGSGSTLIAAEREGRTARLMELDPVYVDVIIRRFAALGGPDEDEIRATREPAPGGKPGKGPVRPRLRAGGRGPGLGRGSDKVAAGRPGQAQAPATGEGVA
jgi:DNA modification methylase